MDIDALMAQFDAVEMGKKTECRKRFDHTCITAHSHCELLGWTAELTPLCVLLLLILFIYCRVTGRWITSVQHF